MTQEPLKSNINSASERPSNDQEFFDRIMPQAQFEQVIEAILEGKYSWACVLILQFSGYNPLHYIPYRTYNRICKDNMPKQPKRQASRKSNANADKKPVNAIERKVSPVNHRLNDEAYPDRCGVQRDLGYIDRLPNQNIPQIKGGMSLWLSSCRD
jgi:hypothetical protein